MSSSAALMAGMVLLFLLITANFFSGLRFNMPRKSLPFFLSAARETCENLSCDTSTSVTSSPLELHNGPATASLEV